MPDDDLALVQAARGGDVTAFEQLVKRYDAKLLRIAKNVTHNTEEAKRRCRKPFSRLIKN
jgi:RNA polymerase sigma-70 factor, ECF subfamily